ncbi:hypothetical protein A2U01_0067914, partial [Trifolium medium]|nr:hypothetical protein [Trifolium medium]
MLDNNSISSIRNCANILTWNFGALRCLLAFRFMLLILLLPLMCSDQVGLVIVFHFNHFRKSA